jgi:hypothetical protein
VAFFGPARRQAVTQDPEALMRSILLFAVGVPIPVILLLAFCTHHF